MKTIHLVAPFHTVCSEAYSHCAFTGKALRFSEMMVPLGYNVIEYSNEGSESKASAHVPILTAKEFPDHYAPLGAKDSHGRDCVIGSSGWTTFQARLIAEINERLKDGDIIAHPFGRSHSDLVSLFPRAVHIETGIGYPDHPFGAWRIFESEAWRHYHWGRDDGTHSGNPGMNRHYSWVIPNYYNSQDWPYKERDTKKDYVLYMNRIDPCKGLLTTADIIKAWFELYPDSDLKFVFAGQGDFDVLRNALSPQLMEHVEYLGTVTGRARAEITGNARAMLMPTTFVEPFGGAGIEGMMTGTPLIASDWGAFTETIQHGFNGFRCKVLQDWIDAIRDSSELSRIAISHHAHLKYSLETCGALYDKAFTQLGHVYNGKGWYQLSE